MSDIVATQQEAKYSGTQSRALELLGDGVQASTVAQTLGVSESYISQLLAEENFLRGVVERRYEHLQRHNKRDAAYDKLEDDLIEKLQYGLVLMHDPMKILRAIQVVNAAKRRGQSTPDSITQQNTIVNLTLPTVVVDRFSITKDVNNQIIEAGEQKLVTVQSGSLLDRVKKIQGARNENANQNGITTTGVETPRIAGD